MVYSLVFYILVISLLATLSILRKKGKASCLPSDHKRLGLVLLGVALLRFFAADAFLGVVNGGKIYQIGDYVTRHDYVESFIRWALSFSECLYLSLMVSDNKRVKWLLKRLSVPALAVAVAYFPWSLGYYLNPIKFQGIYFVKEPLAAILMILEYGLLLYCTLYVFLFEDCSLRKEEWKKTLKTGLIAAVVCLPNYVLGSLFGTTDIYVDVLAPAHIVWMVSIPFLYLFFFLLLRNEDEKTRFSVLAIMVFYLVLQFTNRYKVGFRASRAPFQLCNLAVYLFLFVLLTKKRSILNFLSIANPTGAIIGILVTDDGNLFNFWQSHYMIEHTLVFIIPLLFVSLGYMERRPFREVAKDYFKWFTLYILFCLVLNCLYDGYFYPLYGSTNLDDINFFYLVDCPVAELVDLMPFLLTCGFTLFRQQLYAPYLLFLYGVFTLLSFLLYFLAVGFSRIGERLLGKPAPQNSL